MQQVSIKNSDLALTVLNYGAIIQELWVRDKEGNPRNVVVGFSDPSKYLTDTKFLGACIGRFAGRISGGGFNIGPERYPLESEEGIHLHGGGAGFGKQYWQIDKVTEDAKPEVQLSYVSKHMEAGYPGELRVVLSYHLDGNTLRITHRATCSETTVVNLTNHSYFKPDDAESAANWQLEMNCPEYLETYPNLTPTGKLLKVDSSDYDFRNVRQLGTTSLDTPFVASPDSAEIATLYSNISGIRMKVRSNQPAVVVYTPPEFPAICFETQHYPDAPNFPHFPSTLLQPGETYLNESTFEFDLVT